MQGALENYHREHSKEPWINEEKQFIAQQIWITGNDNQLSIIANQLHNRTAQQVKNIAHSIKRSLHQGTNEVLPNGTIRNTKLQAAEHGAGTTAFVIEF